MHDEIYSEERTPFTIKIFQDMDVQNPFTDWDWEGTCLALDFGRDGELYTPNGKDLGRETIGEWLQAGEVTEGPFKGWKLFPISAYIHSGITVSLGSFSCPWDSGCCGVLLLDPNVHKDLDKAAESTIQTADDYLMGNVYGFAIEDSEGNTIDSCWGFFGDYEEECLIEARSAADSYIADADKHTSHQAMD